MRIALVGAGSLGTVVGAFLTKAGQDIELVDANEEHVRAMNERGAKVTGNIELVAPVRAITPDQMKGVYDFMIYLVKSTYDETALPRLSSILGEEGVFLTLQNGIPEVKVASYMGEARTVGGAVGWAAAYVEPGVSEFTGDTEKMTYDIGAIDARAAKHLERVKGVLDLAGKAEIHENFIGVRWTKFIFNVSVSGISTALGCNGARILDDDRALTAVIRLMVEGFKTAGALGIKLEPIQGIDPYFIYREAEADPDNLKNMLRLFLAHLRDARASMLQDLEKGLPCEVDDLNGHLSRSARKAGVAVPVNDRVEEIIRKIQDKQMHYEFDNIEFLQGL